MPTLLLALLALWPRPSLAETSLLNVSYDPTRRFYAAVNKAFVTRWLAEHGENVRIYQSHGGSGAQARAVTFGLEAHRARCYAAGAAARSWAGDRCARRLA